MRIALLFLFAASIPASAEPEPKPKLSLMDVFKLEYASDPQVSPDGKRVAYVRNFMDVMKDRVRSNIWVVDADGKNHRPVTSGNHNHGMPTWSPDGRRIAYASNADGTTQVYVRWMDSGDTAKLTQLTAAPSALSWSPDGTQLAFSMPVPKKAKPMVTLPDKPEGAEWAEPPKVIDKVRYRADGAGYLKDEYRQMFVLPAEGGSPRQVTDGEFDHRGPPSWTPDGKALVFSANRLEDADYQPRNTEIYRVDLDDNTLTALTDREGPDDSPVVSPDGKRVAYLGFDDTFQGYQVTRLYVMNADGTRSRVVVPQFNRSAESPVWAEDGLGIYFQYSDHGNTKVAYVTLDGDMSVLADHVGGTTIGRPYASGSFSVAEDGTIAFTITDEKHPADVAVVKTPGDPPLRVTALNADLIPHRQMANVEEITWDSSHDGLEIQGWVLKPPGFEPGKKYPMILEIHGGPFADYGPRFSAEMQLYAAEGYVVFYCNPRGSTSYGEAFGNLIHHAYPGYDYDDLMSGVDAVIAKGYVDADRLYVTGGSGGGVLSAWIVGKTDRFKAAVVAKPVINWYSFVLTADMYTSFARYWFPGLPWEATENYLKRSPISLVGNVKTPTMLLTGEQDYRTPIGESEQFYQALKLRRVETVLVRVPGAGHGIAARPSHLMAKVAYVLKWFETHKGE